MKKKTTGIFAKISRGMSLVEVLVATSIIAVAIYGIMMVLSAQQQADGRLRDKQILSQLHYQLIREFLKNQRNEWAVNAKTMEGSNTDTTASGNGVTVPMTNPALGTGVVAYFSASNNGSFVITSSLYTKRTGVSAVTLASSNISIFYPYYNNPTGIGGPGLKTSVRTWNQVQP